MNYTQEILETSFRMVIRRHKYQCFLFVFCISKYNSSSQAVEFFNLFFLSLSILFVDLTRSTMYILYKLQNHIHMTVSHQFLINQIFDLINWLAFHKITIPISGNEINDAKMVTFQYALILFFLNVITSNARKRSSGKV